MSDDKDAETPPCISEKTASVLKATAFVLFCIIMTAIAGTVGAEPMLAFLDWVEENKVAGAFVFTILYVPWLVRTHSLTSFLSFAFP